MHCANIVNPYRRTAKNKLVVAVAKQEDDGILTTTTTMNSECDCISAGIYVGIWICISKTTLVCC